MGTKYWKNIGKNQVYHTEKAFKSLSVHTHICFIMYSKLLGLNREVSASLKTHVSGGSCTGAENTLP